MVYTVAEIGRSLKELLDSISYLRTMCSCRRHQERVQEFMINDKDSAEPLTVALFSTTRVYFRQYETVLYTRNGIDISKTC